MKVVSNRPTLDDVYVLATLLLVGARAMLLPALPHDLWWHAAMGRIIIEQGSIPTADPFSYTQAGAAFVNQPWLAQVYLYGVHTVGGMPLVLFMHGVVLMLTYGLLLWLVVQRSGALRLSIVLLLLTLFVSFDNWSVRPQTYAMPLFVAYLVILTRWREGQRGGWLWLLPLLMVLWVNIHGSFALGAVLIALTFVGEALKLPLGARHPNAPPLWHLLAWGAVTAGAVFLNPLGIGIIDYVRGILSFPMSNLVQEWAPPVQSTFTGATFFIFVMGFVAVLAYARRPPDAVDMLLAGAFFWQALQAERSIIWFVLVVTPLLAVQAASIVPASQRDTPRFQGQPAFNAVLIGLVGLFFLLTLPWIKPLLPLPPTLRPLVSTDTPVAAVAAMQTERSAPHRLFHDVGYGSYLTWADREQPVFIDPRFEFYPVRQWIDYIDLSNGRRVDELLQQYQPDAMLLDNERQARLLAELTNRPNWDVRYRDPYTTYLVHELPQAPEEDATP